MCMMTVLAVASAGLQVAQGVAANDAAKANARYAALEGKYAMDAAQANAADLRYKGQFVLGQARVEQAKAGVDLSSGSPVTTAVESARNIEYDALKVLRGGEYAQWSKKAEASIRRAEGKAALTGSILGGALSLAKSGYDDGWFK